MVFAGVGRLVKGSTVLSLREVTGWVPSTVSLREEPPLGVEMGVPAPEQDLRVAPSVQSYLSRVQSVKKPPPVHQTLLDGYQVRLGPFGSDPRKNHGWDWTQPKYGVWVEELVVVYIGGCVLGRCVTRLFQGQRSGGFLRSKRLWFQEEMETSSETLVWASNGKTPEIVKRSTKSLLNQI